MENSFAVTGFVGKDASIHQFTTASVARFSLAISRNEKNGDENSRTSAFMNVEAGARTRTPLHSTAWSREHSSL